jgi:uncharacterized protein YjeT (DUF2065 family)
LIFIGRVLIEGDPKATARGSGTIGLRSLGFRANIIGVQQEQANSRSKMDYFLCVIGMVMIIEGVPYFAAPDRMKNWMATLMQMAPGTLRRFGLVMMVAGLLLVYLGRR